MTTIKTGKDEFQESKQTAMEMMWYEVDTAKLSTLE